MFLWVSQVFLWNEIGPRVFCLHKTKQTTEKQKKGCSPGILSLQTESRSIPHSTPSHQDQYTLEVNKEIILYGH